MIFQIILKGFFGVKKKNHKKHVFFINISDILTHFRGHFGIGFEKT